MQVSINRANKIRTALEGFNVGVTTVVSLRNDLNEKVSEEEYNKARDLLSEQMDKARRIISYIRIVRDLICRANHENGINPLISEIANLEHLLKFYISKAENFKILAFRGVSYGDYRAACMHRAKLEALDVTKVVAPGKVEVSVCAEQIDPLDQEIKRIKLAIQDLKEKRNELNHKGIVELPVEVVEFLKAESLI